jgi:uncharacterized protein YjbI with pentapeptide repeats
MHHKACLYCEHDVSQHAGGRRCSPCQLNCEVYIADAYRRIEGPACARCGGNAEGGSSSAWDTYGAQMCDACNSEADAEWRQRYSYYSRCRTFDPLPGSPYFNLAAEDMCECNQCLERRKGGFWSRLFGTARPQPNELATNAPVSRVTRKDILQMMKASGGHQGEPHYAMYGSVVLRGVDLRGVDLSRLAVSFTGTDLSRCDMTGANLNGGNFNDANLSGAKLVGATARGVYMSNTNLSGCDLTDADFSGAMLRMTDLSQAVVVRTVLTGASLRYPPGSLPPARVEACIGEEGVLRKIGAYSQKYREWQASGELLEQMRQFGDDLRRRPD